MQIQPLAHMLEDLLEEASEAGVEIRLAESAREAADLPDLRAEYLLRYERAIAAVTELRGKPQFAGGPDDPGYPAGLGCERVACWANLHGIIYVGIACGEDAWLLLGGAKPHPVERDAITLLPPA